jgi:hypothetical protein
MKDNTCFKINSVKELEEIYQLYFYSFESPLGDLLDDFTKIGYRYILNTKGTLWLGSKIDSFVEVDSPLKQFAMKNNDKWYPVPPYSDNTWRACNEKGELIATFETKEDCIKACEAVNDSR